MNITTTTIASLIQVSCHTVNDLTDPLAQCEFVRSINGSCEPYDGFLFDYIDLAYCGLGGSALKPVAILVLLLTLSALFLSLATVADDFLCPSLLAVSDTLRLPDHIAGGTLLALGNAAPDLFSSISALSSSQPHMVFSGIFGSGIFTTTLVTGTVLLSGCGGDGGGGFAVMKRPLLRDVAFYLGGALLVWFFLFNGILSLGESISLIAYYMLYLLVVLVSRYVYTHFLFCGKNAVVDLEDQGEQGQDPNNAHEAVVHSAKVVPTSTIEADLHSIRSVYSGSSHFFGSRRNSGSSYTGSAASGGRNGRSRANTHTTGDIFLSRFYRNGSIRRSHNRERRLTLVNIKMPPQQHSKIIATKLATLTVPPPPPTTATLESNVPKGKYANDIQLPRLKVQTHQTISTISTSEPISGKTQSRVHSTYASKLYSNLCSTRLGYWRTEAGVQELRDFGLALCPVDLDLWPALRWYRKVIDLIKAVPFLVLTLCVPVVDLEASPDSAGGEGWCRLLVGLNIITAPQLLLFLYGFATSGNGFPIWAILLMVSVLLACVLIYTSQPNTPPIYGRGFAFLGFALSVAVIGALADEVIHLLTALGLLFNVTDSILGLTLLAWGNSLGDLIANNAMARHGHPALAIGACFGGPLMNLLLGPGLAFTIELVKQGVPHIELTYTPMMTLLVVTLCTGLMLTVGFMFGNGFHSSRVHGCTLIALYLAYLTFAFLIEFRVLG